MGFYFRVVFFLTPFLTYLYNIGKSFLMFSSNCHNIPTSFTMTTPRKDLMQLLTYEVSIWCTDFKYYCFIVSFCVHCCCLLHLLFISCNSNSKLNLNILNLISPPPAPFDQLLSSFILTQCFSKFRWSSSCIVFILIDPVSFFG